MKPETTIRIGIRDLLRTLGFAVWDMEQNRQTRQTPGFTDLVAMGRGHILFIECKTAKGVLSGAQEVFRDECLRNGGAWFLWRSTEDAIGWLTENGIVEPVA